MTDRKLTELETRFVEQYALLGSGAEAARRAGYSTTSARQIAAELLRKPVVARAVAREKKRMAEKFNLTKTSVVEMLRDTYTNATKDGQHSAAGVAAMNLGRIGGFVLERQQLDVREVMRQTSPEELERLVSELEDELGVPKPLHHPGRA